MAVSYLSQPLLNSVQNDWQASDSSERESSQCPVIEFLFGNGQLYLTADQSENL